MKQKIMKVYSNFCRAGQFGEAKRVLRLLRNHRVNLTGLDDETWNVQEALLRVGCKFHYGRGIQQYAFFEEA